MRLAIPALLASLLTFPVQAQVLDEQICTGFSGVEVIENIECVQAELTKADAELNAVWKKVMSSHPSGGDPDLHRQDIRKSQRAWIAFRDTDCEATSKTGIPKYWELNRAYCLLAHTRLRTQALKEVYVF